MRAGDVRVLTSLDLGGIGSAMRDLAGGGAAGCIVLAP